MVGSGLGNFMNGGIGMFGQQEWQRQARDEAFRNLYMRGLQSQATGMLGAGPSERLAAQSYATSFFPQGATFTGGSTAGGMPTMAPYSGTNLPQSIGGGMMRENQTIPWWRMGGLLTFPSQQNTKIRASVS